MPVRAEHGAASRGMDGVAPATRPGRGSHAGLRQVEPNAGNYLDRLARPKPIAVPLEVSSRSDSVASKLLARDPVLIAGPVSSIPTHRDEIQLRAPLEVCHRLVRGLVSGRSASSDPVGVDFLVEVRAVLVERRRSSVGRADEDERQRDQDHQARCGSHRQKHCSLPGGESMRGSRPGSGTPGRRW